MAASQTITPMNQKPIIIDGKGIFKMRNGKRAKIDTVQPQGDKSTTSFNCTGQIERSFRGEPRFKGFLIWHESGMATGFYSEWDIIEKLEGE